MAVENFLTSTIAYVPAGKIRADVFLRSPFERFFGVNGLCSKKRKKDLLSFFGTQDKSKEIDSDGQVVTGKFGLFGVFRSVDLFYL